MLDRALPALAYNHTMPMMHIQEAFAYCYLASYSDAALQPRVFDSFQRAYGVGQITLVAPVVDGRPGYLMAQYDVNGDKRLIVAIEGMRTEAQVRSFWNIRQGENFVTSNGNGRVLKKFKDHATTIYNELKASGTFMGYLNAATTPITFAGFSLGAACAELVAEKMKIDKPVKAINVCKFASPRVGSVEYVNARNRTIIRNSFYCDRDPIDLVPNGNVVSYEISASTNWSFPFTRDRDARRFSKRGEVLNSFHDGGRFDIVHHARLLSQPMTTDNVWYDHGKKAYRLMMTELAYAAGGIADLRFRFLEFNDENEWGRQFQPGGGIQFAMEQLTVPQPDPFVWDLPIDDLDIAREAAGLPIGVAEGGNWWEGGHDFDSEGATGGGRDADVAVTVREVRQNPPQTFSSPSIGRRRR